MGWGLSMRFFLLGAALLALWMLIWPAEAETHCKNPYIHYRQLVLFLSEKHAEQPRAIMIKNRAVFIEIWTSAKEPPSWSILIRDAKGCARMLASGSGFFFPEYLVGSPT